MGSSAKRQQTMAKIAREQRVKERRALKEEKKRAAAAARSAKAADEALSADFVVCLAIAAPETANLMDARAFAAMRRGAFFINLSRGELVDEAALEAALDSGHLAGASMEVGRAPHQMPSPRLAARLDLVATPHLGGLTPQAAEHQAMDPHAASGGTPGDGHGAPGGGAGRGAPAGGGGERGSRAPARAFGKIEGWRKVIPPALLIRPA